MAAPPLSVLPIKREVFLSTVTKYLLRRNSLETSNGNTLFGIGLLSGQNAQETPVTVSSLGHLAALLSCGLKD